MSIYLDYNASNPVDPRVLDTMIDVYKHHYGNSDSRTHSYGDDARAIVETARKKVASLLNISSGEVFFTSGSTESVNIAVQGLERYAIESGKNHFITSGIEHKSVLETVKAMEHKGFTADYVNPDRSGMVFANSILEKISPKTLLVSIMHVNNETGMIQPVNQIGEELEDLNVLFHIDATQSCGKLVDEIKALKYSMLSFSAHKMGGPQGVGVLILRKKQYKLPPVRGIMYGGQQERGIRPGTVPVALVAGCGKACELAESEYQINQQKCREIRDVLLSLLRESGIKWSINGDIDHCISNTLNICIQGVSSEALMVATKMHCGISNGSACTSKNYGPSYILSAMGVSSEKIANSIRVSWAANIDKYDLRKEFILLLETAKNMAG